MMIIIPDWLIYSLGGCIVGQIPWVLAFIYYNFRVRKSENSTQNS